jgi:ketosteroid isomerase-like protein
MEQSPELRDLVLAWCEAVSRGDTSLVDKHISREAGVRLIGSDPSEWLAGEQVVKFLREEVEKYGGNVTSSPSETEAFSEGTVGWAATHLTITLPDGKTVSPRWSAVFHREDEEWKFVQAHASIAVPNEEAGWVVPA